MSDQGPILLGKYRLVSKRLVGKDRLELLFEASEDYILPSIKFSKEGHNSTVIVPMEMDALFKVGELYRLEARHGEVVVKP